MPSALQFIMTNDAVSLLASPITSTSTTLNVLAGTGTLFPQPATGQAFALTLVSAANPLTKEIVYVTARNADTFTISRAQEGTAAQAWATNDSVRHCLTAGTAGAFVQNTSIGSAQGLSMASFQKPASSFATDVATTNGSNTVTSASNAFSNAQIGYLFALIGNPRTGAPGVPIVGPGPGGLPLTGTISAASAGSVTLSVVAAATQSGDVMQFGPDSVSALETALASTPAGSKFLLTGDILISRPFVNPRGVEITGVGRILLLVPNNGFEDVRHTGDALRITTGQEYAVPLWNSIITQQPIVGLFSGNSVVAGAGITNPNFLINVLMSQLASQAGVKNFRTINAGHSGQNTNFWLNDPSALASDIAQNPDVFYLHWLINDLSTNVNATSTDIDTTLANYNTALSRIRPGGLAGWQYVADGNTTSFGIGTSQYTATNRYWVSVNGVVQTGNYSVNVGTGKLTLTAPPAANAIVKIRILVTIYLVVDHNAADSPNTRNNVRIAAFRDAVRNQLGRQWGCVAVDVFSLLNDVRYGEQGMTTDYPAYGQGEGLVHPLEARNAMIAKELASSMFPPVSIASATNFWNVSGGQTTPPVATSNTNFPPGLSYWSVSGSGWPFAGILRNERHIDDLVSVQTVFPFNSSVASLSKVTRLAQQGVYTPWVYDLEDQTVNVGLAGSVSAGSNSYSAGVTIAAFGVVQNLVSFRGAVVMTVKDVAMAGQVTLTANSATGFALPALSGSNSAQPYIWSRVSHYANITFPVGYDDIIITAPAGSRTFTFQFIGPAKPRIIMDSSALTAASEISWNFNYRQ